jgi:hypothetical protein
MRYFCTVSGLARAMYSCAYWVCCWAIVWLLSLAVAWTAVRRVVNLTATRRQAAQKVNSTEQHRWLYMCVLCVWTYSSRLYEDTPISKRWTVLRANGQMYPLNSNIKKNTHPVVLCSLLQVQQVPAHIWAPLSPASALSHDRMYDMYDDEYIASHHAGQVSRSSACVSCPIAPCYSYRDLQTASQARDNVQDSWRYMRNCSAVTATNKKR